MSTSTPEAPQPMNYVFVDFENVPNVDFTMFDRKPVVLTLLVGPATTKLNAALVENLFEHSGSVQFVRLANSGKNALDFTLSYYLGRAVEKDPGAYFHVVSRDAGFDPLIQHIRDRRIQIKRHDDFSTLTFRAGSQAQATEAGNPLQKTLDHLRKNSTNRPKRLTTLSSHLTTLLGKSGSQAETAAVIEKLKSKGHIAVDGKGAVTYHL